MLRAFPGSGRGSFRQRSWNEEREEWGYRGDRLGRISMASNERRRGRTRDSGLTAPFVSVKLLVAIHPSGAEDVPPAQTAATVGSIESPSIARPPPISVKPNERNSCSPCTSSYAYAIEQSYEYSRKPLRTFSPRLGCCIKPSNASIP